MDETRSRTTRILDKLGQRETLLELAGVVGYFVTLGLHAAEVLTPEQWEHLAVAYSTSLGLIGAGATAQVKRGQQRGEQVANDVMQAISELRGEVNTAAANSVDAKRSAQLLLRGSDHTPQPQGVASAPPAPPPAQPDDRLGP